MRKISLKDFFHFHFPGCPRLWGDDISHVNLGELAVLDLIPYTWRNCPSDNVNPAGVWPFPWRFVAPWSWSARSLASVAHFLSPTCISMSPGFCGWLLRSGGISWFTSLSWHCRHQLVSQSVRASDHLAMLPCQSESREQTSQRTM